jgi:ribosomal protein S27E
VVQVHRLPLFFQVFSFFSRFKNLLPSKIGIFWHSFSKEQTMPITQERIERIQKHIVEHAPNGVITCTICGGRIHVVRDELVSLGIVNSKNITTLAWFEPMVQVQCDTCGHVVFFSAFEIGILPD